MEQFLYTPKLNIKQLFYSPKIFVRLCECHLKSLGKTESYDYDRFINEELNELLDNHRDGKHENNTQLLIDDIVDSMWVILAKASNVTIPLSDYVIHSDETVAFDSVRPHTRDFSHVLGLHIYN